MQVQPYGPQASAPDDGMQQLALLFAEQQLAMQAADAVVQKESEKTLAVFKDTIDAQSAENKALQNENAMLRERLASLEAQRRETDAAYAAETKAKDARHDEEVAALEEKNKSQQQVIDALDRVAQEQIEVWTKVAEQYGRLAKALYEKTVPSLKQQHDLAKEGVFKDRKTLGPGCWEY